MTAKLLAVFVLLIAAAASARARAEDPDLNALCSWPRTSPHKVALTLDRRIATALGLSNLAVPMQQVAMEINAARLELAVEVGRVRGADVCILRETSEGVTILWHIDRDGTVLGVAKVQSDVIKLPNDFKSNRLSEVRRALIYLMYLDSGAALLRSGRLKESISAFDALLKAWPNSDLALYARGIAKLRLGDKTGGRADIAAAEAQTTSKSDLIESASRRGIHLDDKDLSPDLTLGSPSSGMPSEGHLTAGGEPNLGLLTTQSGLKAITGNDGAVLCVAPMALMDDPVLKDYLQREPKLSTRLKPMTDFQDALDAFDHHKCTAVVAGLTFLHRMFDKDKSRPLVLIVALPTAH